LAVGVVRTVYGVAVHHDGLAYDTVLTPGHDRPQLRTRAWATPAREIRREQPTRLGIDREHDSRWVGEVCHLELRDEQLWVVGLVNDDVGPVTYVNVPGCRLRSQPTFSGACRASEARTRTAWSSIRSA
jgi:hypothetical protein